MILSTHAIAGAAVAAIFRANPVLAFLAACASHFLLDMIPHWDYPIRSLEQRDINHKDAKLQAQMIFDRRFQGDLARTGFDFCFGAALALLIAYPFREDVLLAVVLGIVGGVLPDFLQLVYFAVKRGPIVILQKFHIRVHANLRLHGKYETIGVLSQIAIASFFAAILAYVV